MDGRKSACEVNFLNAAGEEKEGEEEEEEEDFGLVVPRHSEPNVRYAREEEEEEEEKKTYEQKRNSVSISWWCTFTTNDTEREKREKAIETLRERRRGILSSVKAEKKNEKKKKKKKHIFVRNKEGKEEEEEEEEEEEKPIVCASSPRQNLKSKRFRMKQEVSESKDFAGQEAKLLASIARLDEVVKRTNEINGGAFAKENELRKKEEEPKRAQPPQDEHALMRSIARLNLKLELTHETIQIHDEKLFRELLQIS
ncbi:unnamed protein product [Bathycoccus prasinos]